MSEEGVADCAFSMRNGVIFQTPILYILLENYIKLFLGIK
jgi:hypothetical protein